jgi:hypothetical protein
MICSRGRERGGSWRRTTPLSAAGWPEANQCSWIGFLSEFGSKRKSQDGASVGHSLITNGYLALEVEETTPAWFPTWHPEARILSLWIEPMLGFTLRLASKLRRKKHRVPCHGCGAPQVSVGIPAGNRVPKGP